MQWRSDFLVEYYGEGGTDGCFANFPDPPNQPFVHGEYYVGERTPGVEAGVVDVR